jgi:hypothetical protein
MSKLGRPQLAIATLALVTGLMALTAKPALAICPHFFCKVNSDCVMFCPSQPNAVCVDNVCQYPT